MEFWKGVNGGSADTMANRLEITPTTQRKFDHLQKILTEMRAVMVAYSGGVDSTLLLKAVADVLGNRVIAVTAISETSPPHERQDAADYARSMGFRHLEIVSQEMTIPSFTANPPDKCFTCQKGRCVEIVRLAAEKEMTWVADGENRDDADGYRPGRAARELGVRSPLRRAGLIKQEVRPLSRELGLPRWNKPAYACPVSRIP